MTVVPRRYRGVWRRTLLEGDGLARDTESTVLWLQASRWHADLRLPPGRPDFARVASPADASPAQRAWLALQQGFSGITEVRGDACQWHRHVDFQPPRAARDIGTLVFHAGGEAVEEYGIDADYHETWVRLPESVGATAAWRDGDRPDARLLVAGDCFFLVRPRSQTLRPGDDLDLLAATRPGTLDFELSFGRVGGAASPWRILHSTLPWREGQALAPARWAPLDAEPGVPEPPRPAADAPAG